MSSHREAPEISKDPVADSTDVYAFVSPDRPDTVTIITNYIPLEDPAGGPNFFEFGDDVLYSINIDNDNDGRPEIVYEFSFTTTNTNPASFLYNTGPDRPHRQPQLQPPSDLRRHRGPPRRSAGGSGKGLLAPPCNVGIRSTPNYPALAQSAIYDVGNGIKVFAGQRLDAFFVDLGSVFDLGALRPFQQFHLISTPQAPGVNALRAFNVHTLAIQVPITKLTASGKRPKDVMAPDATIGVWASASRRKATLRDGDRLIGVGPYVQVSRLGNPLFNEVIVPIGRKDEWNTRPPHRDADYASVRRPARAGQAAAVPVPGRVPEPGGADRRPRRPAGDPADRHPGGRSSTGSRTTPGPCRPTSCG